MKFGEFTALLAKCENDVAILSNVVQITFDLVPLFLQSPVVATFVPLAAKISDWQSGNVQSLMRETSTRFVSKARTVVAGALPEHIA